MTLMTANRITLLLLIEGSDAEAERLDVILEQAAPSVFEIVRASSLADATSYLENRRADCAVVAVGPPSAEGLEIVDAIAAGAPAVPLVVLTDLADDELAISAMTNGASEFLSKSALEGELLVRSIRHAILRKRLETSLEETERIAHVGRWEVDVAANKVTWSRELYRLFGLSPDEKPTAEALFDRTHPDDVATVRQVFESVISGGKPFVVDHRVLLEDGTLRWVRARGRMELTAGGQPERLVGTVQDVTEQKLADDALLYQAFHDPLSALPIRPLFLDRVGQALKRLGRNPTTLAVIYLDIDRFKVINDSLGHPVGDQLLVALATRLTGLVRPGDTLARAGGDEFVMLCEGLSSEAEAVAIADRACTAAAEPIEWSGGDLVLSVSAGIALATSPSTSADLLLRDAEAAMYRAKSQRRDRSAVFAETMRAQAVGRLDTEISLRAAIAHGEIRVYYQPIVNLADRRIVGHEALVRWLHPTRGLLAPDHFLSVAEETGLIVPLGALVLREACHQATLFQGRDPMWARLTMSVNLSGAQLDQPDLIELIASALQESNLKPEHLQLEMTESVLMDDAAATITVLETMKGLGVHLGVDDFGTGYSSLAYLRRFPVDVLKIDRSFVNGLGKDLEDSAVAAAVVSLADTLGLVTVAEGVETTLQRNCLIGLGCSRAQGYLFARPTSATESEGVLDSAIEDPWSVGSQLLASELAESLTTSETDA